MAIERYVSKNVVACGLLLAEAGYRRILRSGSQGAGPFRRSLPLFGCLTPTGDQRTGSLAATSDYGVSNVLRRVLGLARMLPIDAEALASCSCAERTQPSPCSDPTRRLPANHFSDCHDEARDVLKGSRQTLGRIRLARYGIFAMLACCTAMPSFAQTARDVQVTIKPGSTVVVDTVGCAANIKGPAEGPPVLPVSSGTKTLLLYSSRGDQREDRTFTADVGVRASTDGKSCEEAVNRQYTLSFNAAPEVSGKALQTSFQVLVAAFVLALLLESAFALLFNWRPFNAFLNGRSVRSPIMFAASLLLVHQFHFDLMAQLFDAYAPDGAGQPSFGTGVLTAMILAGGSAGVNRILTTLGFRSQLKDGEVPPTPDDGHAWIAVAVEPATMKDKLMVAVSEVTPAAGASVSTAVGIASARRPGWRSLFLGDDFRVPRSGGMRVDTGKFYTITVKNLGTGTVYDVTGKAMAAGDSPTIFRFGPRAVLDFRIKLN
jgi:hypothetical protein